MPYQRKTLFQPTGLNPAAAFEPAKTGFFDTAQQVAVQGLRRARAKYLHELSLEIDTETRRIAKEHPDDPASFVNAHEAYAQGTLENVPVLMRDRVDEVFSTMRHTQATSIQEEVDRREAENALVLEAESLDRALRNVNEAYFKGLIGARALLDTLNALIDASDFTPEQKIARKNAARQSAQEQEWFGRLDRSSDPTQFVEDFNNNRPTDMAPDRHRQLAGMLSARATQNARIAARANADEQALKDIRNQQAHSRLLVAVSEVNAATPETDLVKLERDADRLLNNKTITAEQHANFLIDIEKRRTENDDLRGAVNLVASVLQDEPGAQLNPNTPDHQEAVGRTVLAVAFNEASQDGEQSNPLTINLDQPLPSMSVDTRAQVAEIMLRTGIVPDNVREHLDTFVLSGGEREEEALDLYDRLYNANYKKGTRALTVRDQLNVDTAAYAEQTMRLVRNGMSFEEAKASAQAIVYADAETKAARETEYKTSVTDDPVDLQELYETDVRIPAAMADAFDELALAHFARVPDMERARNMAKADLQRVWGESGAMLDEDGDSRRIWMKHPPEQYYGVGGPSGAPHPGLDDEWIVNQLRRDYPGQNVVIVADDRTAREARNGAPTYSVQFEDKEAGTIRFDRWTPGVVRPGDKNKDAHPEEYHELLERKAEQTASQLRREKQKSALRRLGSNRAQQTADGSTLRFSDLSLEDKRIVESAAPSLVPDSWLPKQSDDGAQD